MNGQLGTNPIMLEKIVGIELDLFGLVFFVVVVFAQFD
jgi:hypothetical protein